MNTSKIRNTIIAAMISGISIAAYAQADSQAPDQLRHMPAQKQELQGSAYGDFARSWQNAPHNTVVYQQISRVFPTAVVWRGDGPESQFEVQEQDLGGITYTNTKGETETFQAMLDRTFSDGVLILKDGKIVTEQYHNGMKPHTRHHLMSASKSLTSTLFSTFIADGSVQVDKLITDYVPEAKGTAWEGVTVEDVLDMRSDVQYREVFSDPNAEVWAHESAVGWRNVAKRTIW